MNWITTFLRQLTCDHEYEFERNVYGDEINAVGGHRSWLICRKCGKRALDSRLVENTEEQD